MAAEAAVDETSFFSCSPMSVVEATVGAETLVASIVDPGSLELLRNLYLGLNPEKVVR